LLEPLLRLLRFTLERSRPAFHPAAWALFYFVVYYVAFSALWTVLDWTLGWLGWADLVVHYHLMALIGGLTVTAELVRGCLVGSHAGASTAKSLTASGIAGAVAGALFAAYIALAWGDPRWLEFVLTIAIGAALWITIGVCLMFEVRKDRAAPPAP
jgi:hypothetical protein